MKRLKTPIELKGRIIQYKPVAKLSDKKITPTEKKNETSKNLFIYSITMF